MNLYFKAIVASLIVIAISFYSVNFYFYLNFILIIFALTTSLLALNAKQKYIEVFINIYIKNDVNKLNYLKTNNVRLYSNLFYAIISIMLFSYHLFNYEWQVLNVLLHIFNIGLIILTKQILIMKLKDFN